MRVRKCRVCKCDFETSTKNKKICSDECRNQLYQDKFRDCPTCGLKFKATWKNKKVCSDECRKKRVEYYAEKYAGRYEKPSIKESFGKLTINAGEHNREQTIFNCTLEEIALELGVTKSRAHQICTAALIKFKRNWIKMYGDSYESMFDLGQRFPGDEGLHKNDWWMINA